MLLDHIGDLPDFDDLKIFVLVGISTYPVIIVIIFFERVFKRQSVQPDASAYLSRRKR
jgi:hypothetical protein